MALKVKRWLTIILIMGFYLIFALAIRPKAYEQNWNLIIQQIFGCLPNFLAVIGITNLIQIFSKKKAIYKPVLQSGLVVLIYEFTGGLGRKTGIGITFDYMDIIATILGMLFLIWIERMIQTENQFQN